MKYIVSIKASNLTVLLEQLKIAFLSTLAFGFCRHRLFPDSSTQRTSFAKRTDMGVSPIETEWYTCLVIVLNVCSHHMIQRRNNHPSNITCVQSKWSGLPSSSLITREPKKEGKPTTVVGEKQGRCARQNWYYSNKQ
jgi:hypothetical protein